MCVCVGVHGNVGSSGLISNLFSSCFIFSNSTMDAHHAQNAWNTGAAEFCPSQRSLPVRLAPHHIPPMHPVYGGHWFLDGSMQGYAGQWHADASMAGHWWPRHMPPYQPLMHPDYDWRLLTRQVWPHMPHGSEPLPQPPPPPLPPTEPVQTETPKRVAIWNVLPTTDEEGLCNELEEIDFQPDNCIRVPHLDGAFVLGYARHPYLAEAIWCALNGTQGLVNDNGEAIRVTKLDNPPHEDADIPKQILSFLRIPIYWVERI